MGSTLVGSSLDHKHQTWVETGNILAYYDATTITVVKSFIVLAQGENVREKHLKKTYNVAEPLSGVS